MEYAKEILTVLITIVGAWMMADRRVTKLEVVVDNLATRVGALEGESKALGAAQASTKADVRVMQVQLDDLCDRVTGLSSSVGGLSSAVTAVGGQVMSGIAEIQKKLGKVGEA